MRKAEPKLEAGDKCMLDTAPGKQDVPVTIVGVHSRGLTYVMYKAKCEESGHIYICLDHELTKIEEES